jgi:proton-dependent oligopeptide transporter, POT family
MSSAQPQKELLFGHPVGLYTLFFAEMWERFSFYGMRALLVFYMTKGFLDYGDGEAFAVYGAYTALVYMSPFFGGMLADRVLGARRAVVLGGMLMAAGQLLMTVAHPLVFFGALGLIITGNGFFKPNISTIVGSLYPRESVKRDGGFTIFYMGVNLGASMSPLLCGYIGQKHGWHYGFGLATVGMLTGLAVFVLPGGVARVMILLGALAAAAGLFVEHSSNPYSTGVNIFVGIALIVAAVIAWIAIGRGGLPADAGLPPDPDRLHRPRVGPLSAQHLIYLGTVLVVPLFALLVSGFAVVRADERPAVLIPDSVIKRLEQSDNALVRASAEVAKEGSKPAGLVLVLAGLLAAGYLGVETFRLDRIARERMFVVIILMFFVMLFWAFFEQAGTSVNNFTDRNVDRVFDTASTKVIDARQIGDVIEIEPTQAQLGYHDGGELFTINLLDDLREAHQRGGRFTVPWKVAPDNVGMRVATDDDEIPASVFQSVNAIFIVVFGLVFTALWTFLGVRGIEPSTPLKFALGLLQLGLGFVVFWYGAKHADERGMVFVGWLVLGYLLHTTGELCLSPVGLAMVVKLSPRQLVSTVMGTWFLATAFSQYLAAIIAQFTRVESPTGKAGSMPPPMETVGIYGEVFIKIAVVAIASSVVCLALVPLLKRWMHEGHIQENLQADRQADNKQ